MNENKTDKYIRPKIIRELSHINITGDGKKFIEEEEANNHQKEIMKENKCSLPTFYMCTECGSDSLEQKAWVNINTDKLNDYIDGETIVCNECFTEDKWKLIERDK